MQSAATWRDAGRLRVAEPALARLPPLHTPDQRRVLTQVAKLLAFVASSDFSIGVRSAEDPALTEIDYRGAGAFSVREDRTVNLPSTAATLEFLATRPLVELRLLCGPGSVSTAFRGDGLETVEWDTIPVPPRILTSAWHIRAWRLLKYIQTDAGRGTEVCVDSEISLSYTRISWNGRTFDVTDNHAPSWQVQDVKEVMARIAGRQPIDTICLDVTLAATEFPGYIHFEAPDFKNPWD